MTLIGSVGDCYGFCVVGLSAATWLSPSVADAPLLHIQRERWSARPSDDITGERNQLVISPRCRLLNERASSSMTIQADRMMPDVQVLHPLLAYGAAMHAHWAGNLALHGGVVGIHDRAWVFLADGMGGKTSLLAAMAARGFAVLADDLAIVTPDRRVHAGPRCLDLRRSGAALAPEGSTIRVRRHRIRMRLGPCPDSLPLGGFVALRWGREVSVEEMAPHERAALLVDARSAIGPSSAPTLLDLVATRCFALTRPRSFDHLDATIDRLESAVGD